jgi:hypothetical protein
LAELQDEIAKAGGHTSIEDMGVGADRQRAEQAALLRLQHEVVAAKLVSGGSLATNELIQLSAAITATLPPAVVKPMEVILVDGVSHELKRAIDAAGPDDVARVALEMANDRIVTLETENKGMVEKIDRLEREQRCLVEASQPRQDPAPLVRRGDNVVPISSASSTGGFDWVALSAMNSGASGPYLPPDPVDPKTGRRLDADGLPASRRKDGDAA